MTFGMDEAGEGGGIEGIEMTLGLNVEAGAVNMAWSLLYITAIRTWKSPIRSH